MQVDQAEFQLIAQRHKAFGHSFTLKYIRQIDGLSHDILGKFAPANSIGGIYSVFLVILLLLDEPVLIHILFLPIALVNLLYALSLKMRAASGHSLRK